MTEEPHPTGRFGAATSVERVDDTTFGAEIIEGWDIGGNANGGYLLAIAGRAFAAAADRPDPITLTAHYLSPGRVGPVTVQTAIARSGRRFTTVNGSLTSPDKQVLAVLGTFGDLSGTAHDAEPNDDPMLVRGTPPELPAPERCVAVGATDESPAFMSKVELAIHPDDAGFFHGEPTGVPRLRGWFRLHDGEANSTISLLTAVDAFPPTAFNARLPLAWVPTLELTAHIRARPAPGWLACSFETRFLVGGFLEVDGEVWDSAGRLVAQSRQLALAPRG